jgi:hypothetical protein
VITEPGAPRQPAGTVGVSRSGLGLPCLPVCLCHLLDIRQWRPRIALTCYNSCCEQQRVSTECRLVVSSWAVTLALRAGLVLGYSGAAGVLKPLWHHSPMEHRAAADASGAAARAPEVTDLPGPSGRPATLYGVWSDGAGNVDEGVFGFVLPAAGQSPPSSVSSPPAAPRLQLLSLPTLFDGRIPGSFTP